MQIWKRLLILIMSLLVLTGCGKKKEFDTKLFETAQTQLNDWGYIPDRTYSVKFENSIYTVDINGTQYQVKLPPNPSSDPLEITSPKHELTEELQEVLKLSKDLVCSYVEASEILENKSEIIEYISNLPAYLVEMEHVALYQFDTIYLNISQTDFVCEWMIVHELVHAIADFTNGGLENERYPFNLFNEVMTDIITASMNPRISEGSQSGYLEYFPIIYAYIGCFGEETIYSYFYGYDSLLEKLGPELDFFVYSMENMESNVLAYVSVNNSINHWQEYR